MMNKSEIDWCDFSWNPVTGCRRGCEYCYARNQARRFSGDVRVNVTDPQLHAEEGPAGKIYTLPRPFKNNRGTTVPHPAGFEPTFHEYRIGDPARKKKPASIFVCSMADLFGPWVPDEWIARVFEACKAAPWHNYMFLTKYPERYQQLQRADLLPGDKNFWFGATAADAKQTERAADAVGALPAYIHAFVSIEPIMEDITATPGWTYAMDDIDKGYFDWIIVGAETGNRKGKIAPERAWIENIIEAAAITHAPVLLKDSKELRAVWGDDLIQDFPPELRPMSEDNSIPHCKECEEAVREGQGKRGEKITCKATGRHARGRYTRSSPPWCPKRKGESSAE